MTLTLFQTAKPKTFLEMAEVNIATATPRKKKTPTEGKRRSARVNWELTGKHVEKTLMPLLQMLPDFRSLGKKNVAIVLGGSASMIKLKNYFLAKQKELCRLCFVFSRLCFVFCRLEISEQLHSMEQPKPEEKRLCFVFSRLEISQQLHSMEQQWTKVQSLSSSSSSPGSSSQKQLEGFLNGRKKNERYGMDCYIHKSHNIQTLHSGQRTISQFY